MSIKRWRSILLVLSPTFYLTVEILQEMAVCSKEYLENRCAPNTRVPAMEKACLAWEKCMNRDPNVVGRARVSAETFAEIINSFIEPISYKTMVHPAPPITPNHVLLICIRYFAYSLYLVRCFCQILRLGCYDNDMYLNIQLTNPLHRHRHQYKCRIW